MAFFISFHDRCRSKTFLVLFGGLIFVSLLSFAGCEIHRTRTSRVARPNAKAYPGTEATATIVGDGEQPVSESGTQENTAEWETIDISNEYSQTEAWIYAISATILVGLTGIFPLFLPIEIDPSSHDERGAAKFNCILSFAVGGLLGDVFIHLLPEAWAHIAPDDYIGQITVGLWVIVGIILFLSIEKIFGEEEESSCPEEEDQNGLISTAMQNGDKATILDGSLATIRNGEKKHSLNNLEKNGVLKRRPLNGNSHDITSALGMNGDRSIRQSNGAHKLVPSSSGDKNKDTKEKKVKVVGYLNLLANFIDNFTHGIAVAGSFLVSKKVGLLTLAAILLHEVPHEVGDFAILLRSGFDRVQATKSQMSTAVGGLFGAVLTLLSESAQETGNRAAWILPFTAGGFIHIALATVLPELMQETSWKESLKQMMCLLSGIAVMGAVSVLIE